MLDRLRKYAWRDYVYGEGYDVIYGSEITEVEDDEAELIGSQLKGSGYHLPIFDIDRPEVLLRESKTPGHYHLVFDKPMPWRRYKRLLKAMSKAGVVDKEWAKKTIRGGRGYIAVYKEKR